MNYTEEQVKEIVRNVISEMQSVNAKDLTLYQKRGVARNPNTLPEALDRLANDKDWGVRYWVATNPNTPSEALERLANDDDYCVRCGVAKNPNTTPETLERLADDEEWVVRQFTADNPNYKRKSNNKITIELTEEQLSQLRKCADMFSGLLGSV
jgi:hypothetical protein